MLSNILNTVFRTGLSLVPLFVEALACGNTDGSNPQDIFIKAVLEQKRWGCRQMTSPLFNMDALFDDVKAEPFKLTLTLS